MSGQNSELSSRAVDAFNGRDLDALLQLVDPEVEFVPLQAEMEGEEFRGHEGVRRWWANLLGIFPDFMAEIDAVRELGDVTVTRLRLRGQGMESDAPMEQVDWQATKWRDGKAVWWQTFRSEAAALEAAKLRADSS